MTVNRASERCALSDLPPDQCACPAHRGGATTPAPEVVRVGAAFAAQHPGRCPACDGRVEEGDLIQRTDEGAYVHEVCL